VRHRGDDEHDHEAGEQPFADEFQERQPEHVEPDVLVELRVDPVEALVVGEEDPLLPLRRHADSRDEREEQRHPDADAHRVGPRHLLVPGDQLVLRAHGAVLGRDAIGDQQVHEHDHEEHDREDECRCDAGREQAAPRAALPERVEPQVVGVEARQATQAEQEDHQEDDDPDDPAAEPETGATPGLGGRDAHRGAA
jgi:hypothetical protein